MLATIFLSIFVIQTAFGVYLFEKSWKKTQPLRDIDQQFEEKYPAFRRRDRWVKWTYYLYTPFFLIRILIGGSVVLISYCCVKIICFGHKFDSKDNLLSGWRSRAISYLHKLLSIQALTSLTIPVRVRKIDFDYSEYLGQNYKENQIIPVHGPSAIVAGGHHCFADTIAMISKYQCNFAAKQSLQHWPLLGLVLTAFGCIFVNRGGTEEERQQNADQIVNRMKLIEKTGQYTRLAIYPEGSTANGEFILPLKRGAFLSNTSILPIILNYKSNKISIAKDSIYQKWLFFLSYMEFFDVTCEIIECPIFIPNDYLYEKHKNQGEEKWEIYAWAIRDIYSKASGKPKLDVILKQKLEYENQKKEMGLRKRTKGE